MPRFSIAAAAANMAQYLSQSHNGQLKGHSGSLVDRPHLYWPGLQGLVTNPMAWRDRLTNSSKYQYYNVYVEIIIHLISYISIIIASIIYHTINDYRYIKLECIIIK